MEFDANIKQMGNILSVEMPFRQKIDDGEYHVAITNKEQNKTRRQVNYFWKLIREIATKQDGNASNYMMYYGVLLKMAKVKISGIWIKKEALDLFKRKVKHFVVMEEKAGYCLVEVYMGVSEMNKKEMMTLIEITLNYAEMIGVDTKVYRNEFYG